LANDIYSGKWSKPARFCHFLHVIHGLFGHQTGTFPFRVAFANSISRGVKREEGLRGANERGGAWLSGVGNLGEGTDPRRDRGFSRLSDPFGNRKPLSVSAHHPLAGSFDPLSLRPPKYLPLRGGAGWAPGDRKGRDGVNPSATPRYLDAERASTCRSGDNGLAPLCPLGAPLSAAMPLFQRYCSLRSFFSIAGRECLRERC